jgi:5-methylcytosine-specific restriction endonuclease McrA
MKTCKSGLHQYEDSLPQCPECAKVRNKRYYRENRETILEAVSRYSKENPEVNRKASARYRKRNESACRARIEAWGRENVGRRKVYTSTRRARKKNATVGVLTPYDLDMLFAEQGGRCCYCGDELVGNTMHLEHVVPLSRGGAHTLDNLSWACASCNLSKGPKLLVEWRYAA